MNVFDRLIDDASLSAPGSVTAEVVAEHRRRSCAASARQLGPLIVPDDRLAEVGRAAGDEPIEVSAVITGGAGGLVALARRAVPGVRVVGAEAALRDLDDLTGNAARVVAAAEELGETSVYVEIPFAPGWLGAVEEVEAAGLFGKLTVADASVDSRRRLAEQLSGLVEADLSFKAAGPFTRAWSTGGGTGLLSVMLALDALIDGADSDEAAELVGLADPDRIRAAVAQWDDATGTRIRRRLRSISSPDVAQVTADLDELLPAADR